MMEILILDESFKQVCLIDAFESLIWTERFCGCGNFELYTPVDMSLLNQVKQDYYAWLKGSDQVMIIEDVQISTEVETGGHLIISGRSLESILDRRIIWKRTNLNGNLQNAIKKLITENIISPSIANRKIEGFVFQESSDTAITNLTIRAQYTGDNLYDTIEAICKSSGIGFQVTLNDNNQFVFSLYAGIDRSYNQLENPYVIFSPKYENLINSDYIESKKTLKNVSLVAGEDSGNSRKTKAVGTASDLARRELFIDARDIQSEDYAQQLNDDTEILNAYKEDLAETQRLLSEEQESAAADASDYNAKLQAHNKLIAAYTSRIAVFTAMVNDYADYRAAFIDSLNDHRKAVVSNMDNYQAQIDNYQEVINGCSNEIDHFNNRLKDSLSLTYEDALNYESLIKDAEAVKSANETARNAVSKQREEESKNLSDEENATLNEYADMSSKYSEIKSEDENRLSDEQTASAKDTTEYNKVLAAHNALISQYESDISSYNQSIAEYEAIVAEDKRVLDELYDALLEQRGKEKLAEHTISKGFSSQIEATQAFVYGEDFYKGDIVQIINEYGIEARARVDEMVRALDTTGYEMYPTFSIVEEEETQ